MSKKHGLLCLALAALLGAAAFGQNAGEPIVVGVSGPLTGDMAQYGAQWKKGFDLALEAINAKGGVKGRRLAYQFEDSQSDPRQAVLVAQKFVADKRIVAELGDFSSTASMAATPIYQRAGLVQLGFTNSNPKFTLGGDVAWSNSTTQKDDAPALAAYAIRDLGFKRLAVLHLNSDWGKSTDELFVQVAKAQGAIVVADEGYLPDEKDFRPVIAKVKAAKPDCVILISYYNDAALIVQQSRAQGLAAPFVADVALYSPEFLALAGAAAEGLYTSSEFFPGDSRPVASAFVKAFRAKYREDPELFAAIAYDAMNIVAAAIELGGPDRAGIKAALPRLKDLPSVIYGKLSFNADRRVDKPELTKLVVRGGQFVPWEPARR